MKNKCKDVRLVKINHWWFNFKCGNCGKRLKWLPKGDYYSGEFK